MKIEAEVAEVAEVDKVAEVAEEEEAINPQTQFQLLIESLDNYQNRRN